MVMMTKKMVTMMVMTTRIIVIMMTMIDMMMVMTIVMEVADVQSPNQRWELKAGRVNIQSNLANIIIITTIIIIIIIIKINFSFFSEISALIICKKTC